MAPGLVGPEKAARGKTPTDVVVAHHRSDQPEERRPGTRRRSRSAYSAASSALHSKPGDTVLDFFAGSGTTGEAAALEGRQFVLVDDSSSAVRTCKKRLAAYHPSCVGF